ncbi:Transcriptional repressor, BlaI/MecI family [Lachnospiraceae bacterium TWA4]|nr:Transcriptional repressor, BlaI/MecI family [Lachnospiraceae bacterium TWA4]
MEFMTECEQIVMKSVWDAKKDVSLQEIMKILETSFGKQWKRQTISTFLLHLIEKGYVKSYRSGRIFYYVPIVKEDDYKKLKTDDFLDFWFEGSPSGLIASMCDNKKLSKEEKQKILDLIKSGE